MYLMEKIYWAGRVKTINMILEFFQLILKYEEIGGVKFS
jgi:hypothetical protein